MKTTREQRNAMILAPEFMNRLAHDLAVDCNELESQRDDLNRKLDAEMAISAGLRADLARRSSFTPAEIGAEIKAQIDAKEAAIARAEKAERDAKNFKELAAVRDATVGRFFERMTEANARAERLAGLLERICDAWSDEDYEMDVAGIKAINEARAALAEVTDDALNYAIDQVFALRRRLDEVKRDRDAAIARAERLAGLLRQILERWEPRSVAGFELQEQAQAALSEVKP